MFLVVFPVACSTLTFATRDKSPEYTIIHSSADAVSTGNASVLLRDYIFSMTNVNLTIMADSDVIELPEKSILIGNTTFNNNIYRNETDSILFENDDTFILQTIEKRFYINGGKRGVHYGVMEILERFGEVKFLSSDYIFIPELKLFTVEISYEKQSPDIELRSIWFNYNHDSVKKEERNTTNDLFQEKDKLYHYFLRNNFMSEIPEELGGSIHFGGGLSNFTSFDLIPPSFYFSDSPGWFAMDGEGNRVNNTQLCLTNNEMIKKLTSNLIDIIKFEKKNNSSGKNLYSVSLNNNKHFCQCDKCKAKRNLRGNNGYLTEFVNDIAKSVNKVYPDVYIETTITDSMTASNSFKERLIKKSQTNQINIQNQNHNHNKFGSSNNKDNMDNFFIESFKDDMEFIGKTGVEIESNVIPRIFMNTDLSRPINESSFSSSFNRDFSEWSTIASKAGSKLMVWDHLNSVTELNGIFPNIHTFQKNLNLFKENYNVFAYISEGNFRTSFFSELKAYLLSKLLWNTKANAEAIIDDFVKHFYGPAAPRIKQFLDLIQKVVDESNVSLTFDMKLSETDIFDPILNKSIEIFRLAEDDVKSNPVLLRHVKNAALSVYFMKFFRIASERKNIDFHWNNYKNDNNVYNHCKNNINNIIKFSTECKNRNQNVIPLNVPEESAHLAKKISEIISDDFRFSVDNEINHRETVEIEKCVHGYNISYISNENVTIGFSPDFSGRIGQLYFQPDDIESVVNGNFGGIEFNSIENSTTSIDHISNEFYKIKEPSSNSSFIHLDNIDGSIISKEYSFEGEDGLSVTGIYKSLNCRPVISFAFNLNLNSDLKNSKKENNNNKNRKLSSVGDSTTGCQSFAYKIDDGDWITNLIPVDKRNPMFSISGITLLGRESLSFASFGSKNGIILKIPKHVRFERLLVMIHPSNDTVRLIFSTNFIRNNYIYANSNSNNHRNAKNKINSNPHNSNGVEKDTRITFILKPLINITDLPSSSGDSFSPFSPFSPFLLSSSSNSFNDKNIINNKNVINNVNNINERTTGVSASIGYKEDIDITADAETFNLDESLATFVEDSSSATYRAAHCFCNGTGVALWKEIQLVEDFGKKMFVAAVSAKVIPKKASGNVFSVVVFCEDFIDDFNLSDIEVANLNSKKNFNEKSFNRNNFVEMNSFEIKEKYLKKLNINEKRVFKTVINKSVKVEEMPPMMQNRYRVYELGSFIPSSRGKCYASLECGESAFSIDVDAAKLFFIGHKEEIVNNNDLIIGLSVAAGSVVVVLVTVAVCMMIKKRKMMNAWNYMNTDSLLTTSEYKNNF